MTDDEILGLIEEKGAEELDEDEIAAILAAARASPALREAIAEHLRLESYFAASLSGFRVPLQSVFAAVDRRAARRTASRAALAIVAVLIAIAGAVALWLGPGDVAPDSGTAAGTASGAPTSVDASENSTATGPEEPADEGPAVASPGRDASDEGLAVGSPPNRSPPNGSPQNLGAHEEDPRATTGETGSLERIAAAPAPFAEQCFDDLDPTGAAPDLASLATWLEPVGASSRWHERGAGGERAAGWRGIARLVRPLEEQSVLRARFVSKSSYRVVAWSSTGEGVEFERGEDRVWRSFHVRRLDDAPLAETRFALADDAGRHAFLGEGTFELRFAEGRIFLSRGDTVLLTAVCAVPQDLYLVGDVLVRGIDLVQGEPPPLEPWRSRRRSLFAADAGTLEWEMAPGTGLRRRGGAIELFATESNVGAASALDARAPLLLEPLRVLTVWLERPREGLTLSLGEAAGTARTDPAASVSVRFSASLPRARGEPRSVVLAARGTGDDEKAAVAVSPGPELLAVRFVTGPDAVLVATSVDGASWSAPVRLARPEPGPMSFGLHVESAPGPEDSPRLRRFEIRELDGLTRLATREELARERSEAPRADAAEPFATRDPFDVISRGPSTRAASSSNEARARVALIEAFELGVPASPLSRLLRACFESVASDAGVDLDSRTRLLQDLALVSGRREELQGVLVRAARDVAIDGWWDGDIRAHDRFRRLLLENELVGSAEVFWSGKLLELELVGLYLERRQGELRDAVRRLKYFARGSVDVPAEARDAIARAEAFEGKAPGDPEPESSGDRPRASRHPLVEEIGREGYNVAAEFDALLESGAWSDAWSVLVDAPAAAERDLVPDARDGDLLVALDVAVAGELKRRPGLAGSAEDRFGELGRLRLRAAAESNDVSSVRAVRWRFAGTRAALDAERWLGDRAFAAGELERALGHYARALDGEADREPARAEGVVTRRDEILARMAILRATRGDESLGASVDWSLPVLVAPEAGGDSALTMSFAQTLESLRSARQDARESTRRPHATRPVARPAESASRVLHVFDSGARPVTPDDDAPLPPRARRTSLGRILDDGLRVRMVHDPETSVRGTSAGRDWVFERATRGPGGWSGDSSGQEGQDPVARSILLVPTRVEERGAVLALDGRSGEALWTQPSPGESSHVEAAPRVTGTSASLLLSRAVGPTRRGLFLRRVDLLSGALRSEARVAVFRDEFDATVPSAFVRHIDGWLITAPGATLSVDLDGGLRWIRRSAWLELAADSALRRREATAPLIASDRAIVAPPGAPAVEALEIATGRLVWRRVVPALRKLVCADAERVLAVTASGLLALRADDGARRWELDEPVVDVLAVGQTLLALREFRDTLGASIAYVDRIDARSGALLGREPLTMLGDRRGLDGARLDASIWCGDRGVSGELVEGGAPWLVSALDGTRWALLSVDPGSPSTRDADERGGAAPRGLDIRPPPALRGIERRRAGAALRSLWPDWALVRRGAVPPWLEIDPSRGSARLRLEIRPDERIRLARSYSSTSRADGAPGTLRVRGSVRHGGAARLGVVISSGGRLDRVLPTPLAGAASAAFDEVLSLPDGVEGESYLAIELESAPGETCSLSIDGLELGPGEGPRAETREP